MNQLSRFYKAQASIYAQALKEIRNGKKESHWMWYVFPQMKGLGQSTTSYYYGIEGLDEAKEYLRDDILGGRLKEISQALLDLNSSNAIEILGYIDALKLQSCMTLFLFADKNNSIFQEVLNRFYNGDVDQNTVNLLKKEEIF